MSRDHYGNIPKRREVRAYVDNLTRGHMAFLEPGGTNLFISGKDTMTSGRATISGTEITANSCMLLTPEHNGPTSLSYAAFPGYMVVSGTGSGEFTFLICIQ